MKNFLKQDFHFQVIASFWFKEGIQIIKEIIFFGNLQSMMRPRKSLLRSMASGWMILSVCQSETKRERERERERESQAKGDSIASAFNKIAIEMGRMNDLLFEYKDIFDDIVRRRRMMEEEVFIYGLDGANMRKFGDLDAMQLDMLLNITIEAKERRRMTAIDAGDFNEQFGGLTSIFHRKPPLSAAWMPIVENKMQSYLCFVSKMIAKIAIFDQCTPGNIPNKWADFVQTIGDEPWLAGLKDDNTRFDFTFRHSDSFSSLVVMVDDVLWQFIRGSHSAKDWCTNGESVILSLDRKPTLEELAKNEYDQLNTIITQRLGKKICDMRIGINGHSLGGAVAFQLAHEIRSKCKGAVNIGPIVSIGAPPSTSKGQVWDARLVTHLIRVVAPEDCVPKAPTAERKHVDKARVVNLLEACGGCEGMACDHFAETYNKRICSRCKG